jgi:glycosyltransferase involved in cell wall biosynthesis
MTVHRMVAVYRRHVSVFVAPSAFVQKKLQEFGFDPQQTCHLPYCIVDSPAESQGTTEGDEGYVLYFGRLSPEKGLTTLISAMAYLPDLELRIVGDGYLRHDLEHRVCNQDLSNIHFFGRCESGALQRLVANARVTVLPSEWYEVFGQSVAESLLMSRPVVASRIGGIPEVMEDGVHGLLVPPGDAPPLADALRWIASHASTAHEMGCEGRKSVLKRFGVERHYEDLMRLYHQASL